MHIDPWIFSFSAATVIATVWVGFWSARRSKTAHDFYVAGRTVSVGWNASAISGEYLSAASFMGVAGMVMSSGYDALWYPVCYACGYLFLLLFIAGPLRRFGAYTIPDFAEGRFDSPLFRKIAVVFVLFIGFFYTMPQMKGAGTTLAYIFPGLPYWVGVALVGAVITLNVALGGMKGITLVQAFQYWAKMFAISVPVFVLMSVYGHYGKQLGVNNTSAATRDDRINQTYNFIPTDETSSLAGKTFSEITRSVRDDPSEQGKQGSEYVGVPLELIVVRDMRLKEALANYERSFGRRAFVLGAIANKEINFRVESANYSSSNAAFAAGFASNGVALVEGKENIVFAMPLSEELLIRKYLGSAGMLEGGKQSLPEKAPKDSTWISPFGPLTTKAVKAAKPRITYNGAMTNEVWGTWKNEFLSKGWLKEQLSEPLKLHGGEIRGMTEPISDRDFLYFFSRYALQDRLHTHDEFAVSYPPEFSTRTIIFPDMKGSPQHLAEQMTEVLRTNGITLVREGNAFKAFPTKDAIIKALDPRPYSLLYTYSLIIALVCGTAGLPHILVRFYTNPDGVAAKRTTMWVMILIGVFYLFPPVFGVMGRNLFPELYNGLAGVKGTDGVVLKLPKLLNEKIPMLGSILSGITCAGAFAAFMSTFSGLLVSMTGALAHDVYGRMFRPKSTPEQRMLAFKICAVICGGGAILLGFFVETFEINKMVGWAFAIAATSYFPLLFLSAWWRGITMKGAAIGMLVGGTLSLVVIASTMFADQAAWAKPLADFYAGHPLLRILAEQPAIWALPLALFLMIVISKLTRRDIPADIRMKMLVLHAPEKLGLKQEYIQEHQGH